jgi:hypothetical protein
LCNLIYNYIIIFYSVWTDRETGTTKEVDKDKSPNQVVVDITTSVVVEVKVVSPPAVHTMLNAAEVIAEEEETEEVLVVKVASQVNQL